mmetsp:Transcript_12104/g.31015  ORF Transcript_12104/g.31015 Transcript_12104/m.31015 type:complete len:109 (+) Transcript_12104:414-740(+)
MTLHTAGHPQSAVFRSFASGLTHSNRRALGPSSKFKGRNPSRIQSRIDHGSAVMPVFSSRTRTAQLQTSTACVSNSSRETGLPAAAVSASALAPQTTCEQQMRKEDSG